MSEPQKNKGGRPRGRKRRPHDKPLATGQITFEEDAELDALAVRTGQSRSLLVRRAIVRLFKDVDRAQVDFGKSIDSEREGISVCSKPSG